MSDDPPPRIPNPGVAEISYAGELIMRLEKKQNDDLTELEAAILVETLQAIIEGVQTETLDRPPAEVFEDVEPNIELFGHGIPDDVR